jgi:hypothetical protein
MGENFVHGGLMSGPFSGSGGNIVKFLRIFSARYIAGSSGG